MSEVAGQIACTCETPFPHCCIAERRYKYSMCALDDRLRQGGGSLDPAMSYIFRLEDISMATLG